MTWTMPLRRSAMSKQGTPNSLQFSTSLSICAFANGSRNGNDRSVESPHNSVHVIVGFPMASLSWAAFHPVFYLHHNNVDRVYEKYITLESDSQAEFEANGELPKTQGKCLMCSRYFTTHLYHLARNSPNFCPRTNIDIQTFQNRIACDDPLSNAPHAASSIGTDDGYSPSKMLFVDEKWVDCSSSRNEMYALLWKPTVRFNSSDYHFFKDEDGLPRCIQQNMTPPSQDFGGPPC